MKKILGGFFYFLGAFGLLSSFMGLAKLLGPSSGGDGNIAGMMGQVVGLFLIPVLFFWLGHTLRKDEPKS